ncbi:MAG: hypothetical protein V3T53_00935 [Phycisphaerales bacterium]
MKKSNTVLLICGGIAGMLCLSCIGGIAWIYSIAKAPENINIQVDAPLEVSNGEQFVVTIRIENTADETQVLHSIDIWDLYLQGIAIRNTEPAYRQSYHIPIDNTQSFEFYLDILPHETITITLNATAVAAGDFNSFFDACINSDVSYLTYPIRTVVTE